VRIFDRENATVRKDLCGQTDYDGRFSAINRTFVLAALGIGPNYLEADDILVNSLSAVALADGHAYSWQPTSAALAL
jgi:hypothetical protein